MSSQSRTARSEAAALESTEEAGSGLRTAPPSTQKPRRSRRGLLVLAIVASVGAASAGAYVVATHGKETTDDAEIEADVVALAPRVAGQIRKVLVKENQTVKKGDPIVLLDDAEFSARLEKAEAALATAKAELASAEADEQIVEASARGGLRSAKAVVTGSSAAVSSAEVQIAAAKARVERARVEAHQAEIDWKRAEDLLKAKAISQGALDDARTAYDAASAALRQAEAELAASQDQKRAAESRVTEAQGKLTQSTPIDAQIAVAHAKTELARARLRGAEAERALAKLDESYTTVVAPDDGVVSKLSAREGQLAAMGQPLAELVPSRSYVVANFKETQIGRMRSGDRAEVEVDAFPGVRLEGHVESLSGGTGARFSLLPPDNASGNFVKVVQRVPVRIVWDQPPALPLRAGLSADVTVFVDGAGH